MNRDFESKKHKYSANSYFEVLDARLRVYYEERLIFMQDNASIHTTSKVIEWFENYDILTTEWLLYSLDLNLIEHIWKALKELVTEKYLELMTSYKDIEDIQKQLEDALKVCWDLLLDSLFKSLVRSMLDRIIACIKADG